MVPASVTLGSIVVALALLCAAVAYMHADSAERPKAVRVASLAFVLVTVVALGLFPVVTTTVFFWIGFLVLVLLLLANFLFM